MSHSTPTLPKPEYVAGTGFLRMVLLGIGAIAMLISIIAAFFMTGKQVAHSYLFAYFYFFTIVGGAFFWTVLHHAVDADWSVVVRRQLENIISSWIVLVILFVPLVFLYPYLWKWLLPETLAADPMLQAKQPYLSWWFAGLRTILIFGLVGLYAYLLRKHSVDQDKTGHPAYTIKMRYLSIPGIPIIALAITFAAFDWVMAMDYHWYSTMFGVCIFAGAVQQSLGTLIITCFILKQLGYLKEVNSEHFHIMGKFLLAFTIFWAYVHFSQYMLIWYANIPEETNWFVKRNEGMWTYLAILLTAGHFILPFIFLLPQWVKKNPLTLSLIAGWLLCMHAVDHYWLILPNYHKDLSPNILDFTFFIGIGSLVFSQIIHSIGSSPTIPVRDPRIFESLKIKN
ncbi:hypothetical protein DB346_00235 [Verrucomicrobia bacterium LW23]|nr:hypothetical protein DB346_00235 [Verrucomicrobia bacterium LW23]